MWGPIVAVVGDVGVSEILVHGKQAGCGVRAGNEIICAACLDSQSLLRNVSTRQPGDILLYGTYDTVD